MSAIIASSDEEPMKVLHYANQKHRVGLPYDHLALVEARGHKFKVEVSHDDREFLGKAIVYVYDANRLQFNPLWEEMIHVDYKSDEGATVNQEWELLREPVMKLVEDLVNKAFEVI